MDHLYHGYVSHNQRVFSGETGIIPNLGQVDHQIDNNSVTSPWMMLQNAHHKALET